MRVRPLELAFAARTRSGHRAGYAWVIWRRGNTQVPRLAVSGTCAWAIRARIPVMASKAVPTDLTAEMARSYGLTPVCSARSDSLKVFNGSRSAAPGLQASRSR